MIRDRLREALGLMVIAIIAALVVFGLLLENSQHSARNNIAQRFKERAIASAALTSSLFGSASGTSAAVNVRRYSGRVISPGPLARRARESNNRFLLVIDARRHILAASPGVSASMRRRIAANPSFISQAVSGRPYALSDVLSDDGRPALIYAQGFPTPYGRRVLVSGLDPQLIAAFLGGSLKQLPTVKGGHTYLLDSNGLIVASPEPAMTTGKKVSEPGLLAALRSGNEGGFGQERHFAADRIAGSPWRVVLTAPEENLFASVRGSHRWGPWALFVGFGLAALAAVALAGRVIRTAARMAVMNAELGAANTELDTRARELARSNEELERFASVASHDLQEPLRKVQMFSERIIHHEADRLSERGREYLERMDSATRRMQSLIDGLLVYSQVGTQATAYTDVDLEAVAREVVDDLQAVIAESGGRVEIGELPHVRADALQMRQLMQNLVSNGLKFRREGVPPVVTISGAAEAGTAVFTVADNGIGFEPHHAHRIFNVFERLHSRADYSGTGIGLALCRRIAERHGGSVSAESKPGEGARFTVVLPARGGDRRHGNGAADEEPRLVRS